MSKYIDRIIEIQDDNGVWNAVTLGQRSSIVFEYEYNTNYDMNLYGTLVEQASPIETHRLAIDTREHITKSNLSGLVYGITLKTMKMQVTIMAERAYSQLADSFHDAGLTALLKAVISKGAAQSSVDQECTDPRMEYDSIIENLLGAVQEMAKIEAIASYVAGVTNPDRIRVVFFQN